jgi:hypothetical protein
MLNLSELITAFSKLDQVCTPQNQELQAAIQKSYFENNWLTNDNYWEAINNWLPILSVKNITNFCSDSEFAKNPKKVGIIMAGNIPMVGFHDLLCVLLSGNIAVIKPSSDDKHVMPYLLKALTKLNPELALHYIVVERMDKIDAVIATGSNNSFRYFEYYFKNTPSLLRKNRKSLAVISGEESSEELRLLADDVFKYYGLGCRNVSLIFIPTGFDFTKILDQFMAFTELSNHNKFANNYTYHRALLLMNSADHLDTGFALFQEKRDLNAPLSCIYYTFYDSLNEVYEYISDQEENIQCIVGKNIHSTFISLGTSQQPDLKDFADNINTFEFLNSLNN